MDLGSLQDDLLPALCRHLLSSDLTLHYRHPPPLALGPPPSLQLCLHISTSSLLGNRDPFFNMWVKFALLFKASLMPLGSVPLAPSSTPLGPPMYASDLRLVLGS